MPTFRVFTNDRGRKGGIPKYSCLCEVEAKNAVEAIATVNQDFGPPNFAPIAALSWPADAHGKAWLEQYT